jgi:argininosuccinate lyase
MFRKILNSSAIQLNKQLIRSFSNEKAGSPKLWGGRFSRDTDTSILKWIESISTDSHFVVEDIWGSLAHVSMLGYTKVIPHEAASKILPTLLRFQNEYKEGKWQLQMKHEDTHLNVEAKLIEALGMDVGGRMHTTRSRNDQVALDSKLLTRRELLILRDLLVKATEAFIEKAYGGLNDVKVSYTHIQHAQPVSVAFWLCDYISHFVRDLERMKRAYDCTDLNPLGAGAIAGSSYPIDRSITSDYLGFQRIQESCMDAVSNRDYFLEVASTSNIFYNKLSRLAEEFIIWCSWEFQSITLDDGFAMGSSMMPQKKNPGMLELMRGRAGRVQGLTEAAFTMMKGLHSGYNRDFHEDKEITIYLFNILNRVTEVLPPLIQSTKLNLNRMSELATKNFSAATELANYLVRDHNVPFREAHHIVGSLVGKLYRSGKNFDDFQTCKQHMVECKIKISDQDLKNALDPKHVMLAYTSLGGTAPEPTKRVLDNASATLKKIKAELEGDQKRVDAAYNACRNLASEIGNAKNLNEYRSLVDKHRPKSLLSL